MSIFDLFRSRSKNKEQQFAGEIFTTTTDKIGDKIDTSAISKVRIEPRTKSVFNISGVRTIFVFINVPRHVEINAGYLPLIEEGVEMDFDFSFRSPKHPNLTRDISGTYVVERRVLRWSTSKPSRSGLTQYLEWKLSNPS